MADSCLNCSCTKAGRNLARGRVILATEVAHTATALRTLARRQDLRLSVLAPGLLELEAEDPTPFLGAAVDEFSVVEAAEVRCLVAPHDTSDLDLLARAIRATSLAVAGARVAHADLVPLFDNEKAAFYSVYQPIVDIADGVVVGHEALLRATDAEGVAVMPDLLFPAAEAAGWTGLLDRIGRTTALQQAGPWLGDDALFINFIPTSIYRPEICLRTTERAAAEAGLRLEQLVFEVTESHMVRDVDHLDRVFDYYRERGCRVALDDLGAGYSSLNLLLRLKPDVVKLDKDIVQALPSPTSRAVVAAIVSIAHTYGGKVLAECVETEDQADAAFDLGVDLGQGWYFGRPVRPLQLGQPVDSGATTGLTVVDPARPDPAIALARETHEAEPKPRHASTSHPVVPLAS